jgi:hypothetical protein
LPATDDPTRVLPAGIVGPFKPDGTVWVWGDNSEAQLGHTPATAGDQAPGSGTGAIECNPQPAQLHGLP